MWLVFADAGGPAEQGENAGQQPDAGRAEPGTAASTRAAEGAAHPTLPQSAGEL